MERSSGRETPNRELSKPGKSVRLRFAIAKIARTWALGRSAGTFVSGSIRMLTAKMTIAAGQVFRSGVGSRYGISQFRFHCLAAGGISLPGRLLETGNATVVERVRVHFEFDVARRSFTSVVRQPDFSVDADVDFDCQN